MMRITILGSTGSIGRSTLDVIARHPDRYSVFALGAHRQAGLLAEQCLRFSPRYAVMADPQAAAALRSLLSGTGCRTEILAGTDALSMIASAPETDSVMAAIVGAAGLGAAISAARAGKRILLANKESLVMAGDVFLSACRGAGAMVLPIDSEHNAVFQCLPGGRTGSGGVRRVMLTASGGPFRRATREQISAATPEQACAHPKWSMGRKISVDSATLMNKGLELIEAHYLFDLPEDRLDVVVHPQSIVHSLVEYADGSVLAQLGNPDMRTPIAHALAYPERIDSGVAPLDLAAIGKLEFEPPDHDRFPCLGLARQALRAGGAAPCVLNAANEIAVEAFLDGRIGFDSIARVSRQTLDSLGHAPAGSDVLEVLAIDAESRRFAREQLKRVDS
jgi:1-deoxy-D-xylulose-5-phosphate reductoisomerase